MPPVHEIAAPGTMTASNDPLIFPPGFAFSPGRGDRT